MGAADEEGARVGYCRAAGLRHQACIPAGQQRGEKGVEIGRAGFFGQLADVELAHGARVLEALEFGAGRARVLDDKVV